MKLLVDEVGTSEAGQIWDEPDVLVAARLGHVEARAALGAALRQDRISNDVFRSAVEGLEVLWSQVSIIEIDETIIGDISKTGNFTISISINATKSWLTQQ